MNRVNLVCSLLLLAGQLSAANPGDEVVVVYNSRMPESKSLAEYYAARRHVPATQLFGFDLGTREEMTRTEFADRLQQPLAKALEENKLWRSGWETLRETNGKPSHVEWGVKESKIRYVALCYGVPVRIAEDPNLKEPGAENLRPELRRNGAAVDSELAWLPGLQQRPPLTGTLLNPAFAATNPAAIHPTNGVLMVARLDGPSAEIARGLVDKAIEAESNGLWGRAYFDLRNITDPGYKMGDDWIRGGAETCRRMGFETVVDQNAGTFPPAFPMSQIAIYCGWYDYNVSGPFTRSTVEFMPGAFAYHIQSHSAVNLRSATLNWVGPLLAKGATITMGAVAEPYLAGTPDVALFLGRFLFLGFSFGEAAYASQNTLSWQTTFVGDPLYRPFQGSPQQLHEALERQRNKLIEWSYLRLVNLNLARGAPADAMADFVEHLDATNWSAVLTEKLGDLDVAQGKLETAIQTYAAALKLDPSPQQRVRLRLALEARLLAADRQPEACDNLEKLLQENADYPDKLAVYRKLLSLAQKLGKKEDAARFDEIIQRLTPPPPPPPKTSPPSKPDSN